MLIVTPGVTGVSIVTPGVAGVSIVTPVQVWMMCLCSSTHFVKHTPSRRCRTAWYTPSLRLGKPRSSHL